MDQGQTHAVTIAPRVGTVLWPPSHPNHQLFYDDERRPDNEHVVARLRQYDRALWVRYNRVTNRWELWRWTSHVVPRERPARLYEIGRRAAKLWAIENEDGTYRPVDARLFWQVWRADSWRRFGTKVEAFDDQLWERDLEVMKREKRENLNDALDWGSDNKHQIRKAFGGTGQTISIQRGVKA